MKKMLSGITNKKIAETFDNNEKSNAGSKIDTIRGQKYDFIIKIMKRCKIDRHCRHHGVL